MSLREVDRGRFLDLVTHELRAPLGATRLMLSVLLRGHLGPLEPRQAELLGRVDHRLEQLQSLVDDLMELAAVTSEVEDSGESTDVPGAVRDACARARPAAEAYGIDLHVEVCGDFLPVRVRRRHLAIALAQLLTNAVKYGGVSPVLVRCVPCPGAVAVTVADEGIGIPASLRGRLFEPFFRGANAEATGRPGSGLGLVIVQEVLQDCGGSIRIESVEARGTTVHLTLPVEVRETG